jgi:hypothetical protein
MNINNHDILAQEIETEYSKLCSSNSCGDCKYAFKRNCKILFVLDYLEIKELKQ